MKHDQIQIIEAGRLEPGDLVMEASEDRRFPHDYDFDEKDTDWVLVADVWKKGEAVTLLLRDEKTNRPPEPIEAEDWQVVIVARML